MKLDKNFNLLFLALFKLILLSSCINNKEVFEEIREEVLLKNVRHPHELNVSYRKGSFFVLHNFRTQLDIYSENILDSAIQLVEMEETYAGFQIKGQYVSKFKYFDNETVAILKISPNEFHFIDTENPYRVNILSIDTPPTEFISDFAKFDENHLIVSTFGYEKLDQYKIYLYNIKNQTSKLLFEETLKHPVAEYIKVFVKDNKIYLLNPFHKILLTIDKKGKLISKRKFSVPEEFNYNFTENKWYATMEEITKAEVDLQEYTRVMDFTLYNDQLLLIVTQHSDRKTLSRNLIKCAVDDTITAVLIEIQHIPIHFGPNDHLFNYFEKDSLQHIEIVPMNSILE
jgi:hypothetical protein